MYIRHVRDVLHPHIHTLDGWRVDFLFWIRGRSGSIFLGRAEFLVVFMSVDLNVCRRTVLARFCNEDFVCVRWRD